MKFFDATADGALFPPLPDPRDGRVVIMGNGRPRAVLLDFDDYCALYAIAAHGEADAADDPERFTEMMAVVAQGVRAALLRESRGPVLTPATTKPH